MTTLLLDTDLGPGQRRLAGTVRESSEALLRIINDLLDFSKLEAGRLEFQETSFDLRALAEGVVDLLAPRAAGKGIALDVAFSGQGTGAFRGDPGRLRQILLNLAGNAINFTEKGSVSILIATEEQGTDSILLKVKVVDTGIGIPEAARPRLFNLFTQADASVAQRYGGSGLGLSICKRLVEMMGGGIGFTSEEGVGSTFWFQIPLARSDEATGLQGALAASAPPPSALRILVVDDNAINLEVAEGYLARLGYQSAFAMDGQEAVERVASGAFDLVLMDMQMPVMDGIQATRGIRALPGAPGRTVIVGMTANAMESDRLLCLEAGMDDYLPKPIDRRRLKALLHGWESELAVRVQEQAPLLDEDLQQDLAETLGTEAFSTLVAAFHAKLMTASEGIREAHEQDRVSQVVTEAHTLRGAAANLGFLRLAQAAAGLERAGAEDPPKVKGAFLRFWEAATSTHSYLEATSDESPC